MSNAARHRAISGDMARETQQPKESEKRCLMQQDIKPTQAAWPEKHNSRRNQEEMSDAARH